ncbi:MAG: SDR family NAD(P)-dependent oxidoreductase [Bacteroidetes bacterium]|nr:SDR family NAD(P)-dependent oxidoreductase [Bacteroidota bacterium]
MTRTIFITGASSGFGKACTEKFAANGDRLILLARRKDRLESLAEDLKKNHRTESLILAADVREQATITEQIDQLPAEWSQIDVLINNAGLALGRDFFEEANLSDWNTMIDTNVKGLLYVAQAVAKKMSAQKNGHILNIGSIAGKEVYEKGNVYCATKFAVDAISKAMRIDLLRHGIKVTAIHPGAAETEFSLVRFKGDSDRAKQVYKGFKPLSGEDIAAVAFYCAGLPAHVCINDLTLTCTQQGSSTHFWKE